MHEEDGQQNDEEARQKAIKRARTSLQRTICKDLRQRRKGEAHHRIRGKLKRWELQGLPRQQADDFQKHLKQLQSLVPPRVRAAVLNTAWNRWTTERRFQRRDEATCRCVFGCPPEAEDSLEH